MSEASAQLAVFAIIILALTVAYWIGRNRSQKARLAIGLLSLPIALVLTVYARHSTSAAWQQSEVTAYAYLTAWLIFTVLAVGLPMWVLSDWLQSKLSQT